jgi:nondiscriminating aspartyl-tRNA synthetase
VRILLARLRVGFIDGVREVIELEREVIGEMFDEVRRQFAGVLAGFDSYLPSLDKAPVWEFDECLDRLRQSLGRDLAADDLDPLAERQLCAIAETECGVAAVL